MIPFPAFKPNAEGGYTFCPKCAAMWAGLVALLVVAVLVYRKRMKGNG